MLSQALRTMPGALQTLHKHWWMDGWSHRWMDGWTNRPINDVNKRQLASQNQRPTFGVIFSRKNLFPGCFTEHLVFYRKINYARIFPGPRRYFKHSKMSTWLKNLEKEVSWACAGIWASSSSFSLNPSFGYSGSCVYITRSHPHIHWGPLHQIFSQGNTNF